MKTYEGLLDYLEDFRWFFIRSIAAVGIGMALCLIASNYIVALLRAPLDQALMFRAGDNPVLIMRLGTNDLWRLPANNPLAAAFLGTTNRTQVIDLVPVRRDGSLVFLMRPVSEQARVVPARRLDLKTFGPASIFMVAIQIGIYGGLALAFPLVVYFAGHFFFKVRGISAVRLLRSGVVMGAILFVAGMVFCYFILLPVGLRASIEFARWMGFDANEWRADSYISFVCRFMLALGVGFQLPVVILMLVKLGFVDHHGLKKFRAYWLVINLVLSAIATPTGDPVSMLLMALPLQLLYEISILIARRWHKREEDSAAAAI